MMRLCDSAIVTPFPERDRVIPELLYGSGIRVSELVAVNLSDFKYKDALLVRGKGRKERMVPVTACAQSAIDAWLPVREQLLAKFNLKTDALLFRGRHENVAVKLAIQQAYAGGAAPTHRGLARHLGVSHGWISVVRKKLSQGMNAPKNGRAERLDVRSVRRILKATAKAKGLPDYHPHQLRHACGTHLHDNDVDLLAISRLLGHSRLATTQVYTRVSVGRMMRAYRTAHPHAQ